ncbi:SDR family NAD(P)-dependent oxidoreductase [Mycolicibacterium fluoranthenivorans]|jgi:light-dependent protochlorophyllide reductase|uniref:SDR family NAD(P)-dependent oxidoreductase n=1 Tax=Mycolicibacterium fluoranthenivorans TaxID=258505 RepID=A0A7G8PFL9_9MYCO|nr:SDR family NAD(P)-dependent oxidoreductase [Mycolicibacterium fluoranthenivorans]QNJ93135.1 SDR family NAD(P)-dependent oxidoreductase [Mycolicibacterium fluoranthenivorans]
MTTRSVIITGANAGLGLECARAILAADECWHVVLAVRDPQRGAAAVAELGTPDRCTVLPCDLASLQSVRAFPAVFAEAGLPPLHALVCNAGLQIVSGLQQTADGVEMTFGVNHLGHFALVDGLLEHLVAPARIVLVASGTHDPEKLTGMPHPAYTSAEELAHPQPGAPIDGRRRYTTSKLCNVLFAYELDRRLGHGDRGITVTAFDPGLMPASGLSRDYSPAQKVLWRMVSPLLRVLPNVHSVATSGANLAALAVDPRFAHVTGEYFEGAKPIRSSADSYDTAKARDLWDTSERLAAL